MLSLTKILAPVDFSEASAAAARHAGALACHFKCELTLLHVMEPPGYELGFLEAGSILLDDLAAKRELRLEKQIQAFVAHEFQNINVRRLVVSGDAARNIVDWAQSEKADLIVMSTRGYGTFRRFILGSVTSKVLHDADCPIMTGVHLEEVQGSGLLPVRDIACGIDLGEQSGKVLDWAVKIATDLDARLFIIHAVHVPEDTGEQYERLSKKAEHEIRLLQSSLGCRGEVVVTRGKPAESVCRQVEELSAGLLVIGRSSQSGVFGRLRANAYEFIRQSPCPVISI